MTDKKGKGSPYPVLDCMCRVLELNPVLGTQPAGNASHTPGAGTGCHYSPPGLQLPSQTFKRAATNVTAW